MSRALDNIYSPLRQQATLLAKRCVRHLLFYIKLIQAKDLSSSPVLPKAINSPNRTQKSSRNPTPEEIKQPCSQKGHESTRIPYQKRKRLHNAADSPPQVQDEPTEKRARILSPDRATGSREEASNIRTLSPDCVTEIREEASNISIENDPPIEYWRKTGKWPKKLFEPDPNMNQPLAKKRSSSAMSYAQSVREVEKPSAHTPEYERRVLAPAGIILDQQVGEATISNDCKQLCATLVGANYEPPEHSLFQDDLFQRVLNSVRSRNEKRVMRDIMPCIAPSAELLFLRGASKLEYLIEEIEVEWSKCVSLAGPLPKPDFVVGFSRSGFTDEEIGKLQYYGAPEKPTLFTENLYFPFLICEAKVRPTMYNINSFATLFLLTFSAARMDLVFRTDRTLGAPVRQSTRSFNSIEPCLEQRSFIERSLCFLSPTITLW